MYVYVSMLVPKLLNRSFRFYVVRIFQLFNFEIMMPYRIKVANSECAYYCLKFDAV